MTLKITITGDPVIDNLKDRQEAVMARLRELAYRRLQLIREVEDIDKLLGQFEGARAANDLVKKDIDLKETVAQARREAAAATAKESAQEDTEVKGSG